MNIAIITGASSGLGEEFARQMDRYYKGVDEFWLIARRSDRLEALQRNLERPSRVLALDLSEEVSLSTIRESLLATSSAKICVLVNAAGFGMIGEVEHSSFQKEWKMLDVNVKALTALTNLCLPYFGRNSIVFQVASAAAFMPQPGFAVYAASKAYVLSYSMALSEELRSKGIRVIAVCPGAVATEFFDVAESDYKMPDFKNKFMAKKENVVRTALKDARDGKLVSAYGGSMKALRVLAKVFPHELLIRIAMRISKTSKKS